MYSPNFCIGCDFFDTQPKLPTTPDVFLLRTIVHDWSDKYSIKLLSNLRAAAGPNTKLVLIDSIINYACEAPSETTLLGKGNEPKVPAPLLPNLGGANLLAYEVDVVVRRSIYLIFNLLTELSPKAWILLELRGAYH